VTEARRFPPPWSVEEQEACFTVRDADGQALATSISRTPRCTVEELMRTALLFVIVVAMVATGLWLFVAGLFLCLLVHSATAASRKARTPI
jgi:hypothetical protein